MTSQQIFGGRASAAQGDMHDRRRPVPARMQAILMREFGGPEVLRIEEVATPHLRPGEIIVQVAAVEVSRTRDLGTRSGRHPFSKQARLPLVLGGHFAGTVAAVGDGVDPSLAGRPVAVMGHHTCGECAACRTGLEEECARIELVGIHRWGSYAEYASVHGATVHPVPDDLDLAEAAALAATGPVGLTQLQRAGVSAGDSVILTGATGALASTIIALAALQGIRVIGLSRRGGTGNTTGITTLCASRDDLPEAILSETGGVPPRAAIDNVCAPEVFQRYFATLANGGHVIVSGAIGNPDMPVVLPVPARALYSRSLALVGVRSHTAAAADEFWHLVRDGFRLPPGTVHQHPLENAAAVHADIAAGSLQGHNVLTTSPTRREGAGT